MKAERDEERGRDERAEHEHLAVGEVDQLDDAVDERVADRHQRPDGAVGDAGGQVLAQADQVAVVAQVLEAVYDGQGEQYGDQAIAGYELLQSLRGDRLVYRDAGGFHDCLPKAEKERRPGTDVAAPGRTLRLLPVG